MDDDNWIRCCPGECATFPAAVSILAQNMEPTLRGCATKSDREALARVMLTASVGRVEIGPHTIEWRPTPEDNTDIEYRIT